MTSSGVDKSAAHSYASDQENAVAVGGGELKNRAQLEPVTSRQPSLSSDSKHDSTHRTLKSRHIQLIGIGGTIGTALYVRKELYTP
jgi:amino acid transporter